MKKTITLFSVAMTLLFAASGFAGIIYVPANQPTIQAAIDAAANGDTVLVSEGTYYENITFKGKAITVASHFLLDADTAHISQTIINGSKPSNLDNGSVVYFTSNEDTSSVICGFTITGGSGTVGTEPTFWTLAYAGSFEGRLGGGILVNSSGGKIQSNRIENISIDHDGGIFGIGINAYLEKSNNKLIIENNFIHSNSAVGQLVLGGGINIYCGGQCRIVNNRIIDNRITGTAIVAGGGIFCKSIETSATNIHIAGNTITDNKAISSATFYPGAAFYGGGGGIYILESSPEINNNIIAKNSSTRGGALHMMQHYLTSAMLNCRPRIINNTIIENTAIISGGGLHTYSSNPYILNTILRENSAPEGAEIFVLNGAVDIGYSNIQGGWSGIDNIDTDPLFSDSNYHLSGSSSSIDAGNPDQVYNDPEDTDNPGYAHWPSMGSLRNDQGAYGGNPNTMVDIEVQENPILKKFEKRSHTSEETTIPYRLCLPEGYNISQQYPLVLALHGAGGAGTDNEGHLVRPGLSVLGENFIQSRWPCFVVAPQSNSDWSDNELRTIISLLNSLIVEFSVDTSRMYVAGGSSGGYAAWRIIWQYPGRFAAAMPMAGGGSSSSVDAIKHISIWAIHGVDDGMVSVSESRNMISALENSGCSFIYTHCKNGEYVGMPDSLIAKAINEGAKFFYSECQNTGHLSMIEFLYSPLVYQWFFLQKKSPYTSIKEKIDVNSVINYQLYQNYPNPFNPTTTIEFSVSKSTFVMVKVFNLLGEEVATLASHEFKAGRYSVDWNARGVPSGVYFYRLQAGSFVETKKTLLLR